MLLIIFINEKIVVTNTPQEGHLGLLLLVVVIKNVAFALNSEIWNEASFLKAWDGHHSDFEYFLDHGRQRELRVLNLATMPHEMVKVVNISDLGGDRHSFRILRPDLAVVNQGLVSRLAELIVD